jgi:hypothetical protein
VKTESGYVHSGGIDLARTTFRLVALDAAGNVFVRFPDSLGANPVALDGIRTL